MELARVRQPVEADLQRLDHVLSKPCLSEVGLLSDMVDYVLAVAGKRLRPLLVLLVAHTFGYQGEKHLALAAIVELLHTATLLHDDVIDASKLRRGRETLLVHWGPTHGVLTGDFLYATAFQMMASTCDAAMMALLAQATRDVVEGEVKQLAVQGQAQLGWDAYEAVITAKTARLFSVASELGAAVSGAGDAMAGVMADFGLAVGRLYQYIDDLKDYGLGELGKVVGDDVREGKPTLPFILVRQHCLPEEQLWLDQCLVQRDLAVVPWVCERLSEPSVSQALEGVLRQAYHQASQALTQLGPKAKDLQAYLDYVWLQNPLV